MAFCAAVALRSGGFVWDDYARHLADPATLALCKKVRTRVDPKAQADFPEEMSASLRIKTSRDESKVRASAKGEPRISSAAELRDNRGLSHLPLGRRRDELAARCSRLTERTSRAAAPEQPGETSARAGHCSSGR